MTDTARKPEFGSDVIVDLLLDLGIEYAAFNPGASFRGIHDSIVNHAGNRPRIVECTHEEISVAIAHGYAKAAGKPMAAIAHDVVGLQHATMAIFNAWCDRVPVLVLGGTGPMDATRRRPWIDWIHTANVQGTQVRDYTKFDDQPYSLAAVPESLIRAFRLATTPPCGPVYVCFDSDIQEEPITASLPAIEPASFPQPARLAPDPEAVNRIAEWLVDATSPVVIPDRVGFRQAAVDRLVELAELLALPVLDDRLVSMNFPTAHPLNLSGAEKELLPRADVVLALDCRDLFGILHGSDTRGGAMTLALPAGAKVGHVTLDMLVTRSWTSDFQRLQPADLCVPAEPESFLLALLPACRDRLAADGAARDRIELRRRALAERSRGLRATSRSRAAAAQADGRIALPGLSLAVWDRVKNRDFVLANGTLDSWTQRIWDFESASQWAGLSGGAGLGYGLGASAGVALAHRGSDKIVVNFQADGDALMTPGALWTIAQQKLPVLTLMNNNRAYQNSVDHAERVARVRRRPV
ncbi:MAG: thiamine pyrophosphate-binding protein, partial [Chloroflexota bacterium]|nr:thiamine pyrophosphate-binding protein [Chloroflexota bacterium]